MTSKSNASLQIMLAGFNTALLSALLRALSAYLLFIPAIIWTWFAIEVIVPALNYQSSIALLLLLPTGLAGYAAAAVKASGRTDESLMRLYLMRFSAVLEYCWLYSYYLICALVLTVILSFFGNINNGGFISGLFPLYGVLFILMCTRFWPMIVVPFLYSDDSEETSTIWKKSSLRHAWSLTQAHGTFLHITVPLFIIGGFLFGSCLILRPVIESSVPGLFLLDGFIYAIALPIYITLIVTLTENLDSDCELPEIQPTR